jgi:hypothetical protein
VWPWPSAGFAAWKTHGLVERHAQRRMDAEQQGIEDDRKANRIALARAGVAAAGADELDRLLAENRAAAQALIVPGTSRDRSRTERR